MAFSLPMSMSRPILRSRGFARAQPPSVVPVQLPCRHNPKRNIAAQVVIRSRVERIDEEIEKVLFSAEQLNEVLDELGRKIGEDYKNKHLLVLGVLKGGFMFTADLIRHINPVPPVMEVDFFKASSYGNSTETSGTVKLDDGFDLSSVKGKHVLVSEDIIDSGLTMSKIVAVLRSAGAMSVRVVVLLDKRSRRKVTFEADYVGCICPDEFVVGFGIDLCERFRNLPYIGVPKAEVIDAILGEKKRQQAESSSLSHSTDNHASKPVHAATSRSSSVHTAASSSQ